MFKKTWHTSYEGIDIKVDNAWSVFGETKEAIFINGERVYFYQGSVFSFKKLLTFKNPFSSRAIFGAAHDFYVNDTKITVKLGNNAQGTGVACQIFINNEFYYGDDEVWLTASSSG